MDRYKITYETWNKIAGIYQDKFMDYDLYDNTYDIFCELLKDQATVLELACGPGNITKYLLTKRPDLQILATDFAPNMIELAKQNNPSANFQLLDCRSIDELSHSFDAILCGFCLPYLSLEDCDKLIADSFQLLNKGGLLYLSAIEGDYTKSGFETGATGDQCYVYYHSEKAMIEQMNKYGFEVLSSIKKKYRKGEEIDTHLILIGQKS